MKYLQTSSLSQAGLTSNRRPTIASWIMIVQGLSLVSGIIFGSRPQSRVGRHLFSHKHMVHPDNHIIGYLLFFLALALIILGIVLFLRKKALAVASVVMESIFLILALSSIGFRPIITVFESILALIVIIFLVWDLAYIP